jgi:hypothetical protein
MVEMTGDMTAQRPWAKELLLGFFGYCSLELPAGSCSILSGSGGKALELVRQV